MKICDLGSNVVRILSPVVARLSGVAEGAS
jgi:hypothetical protein